MAEEKAPRRRRRWIVFALVVGAGGWLIRSRKERPAGAPAPVRPNAPALVPDPTLLTAPDAGRPNPSAVPGTRRARTAPAAPAAGPGSGHTAGQPVTSPSDTPGEPAVEVTGAAAAVTGRLPDDAPAPAGRAGSRAADGGDAPVGTSMAAGPAAAEEPPPPGPAIAEPPTVVERARSDDLVARDTRGRRSTADDAPVTGDLPVVGPVTDEVPDGPPPVRAAIADDADPRGSDAPPAVVGPAGPVEPDPPASSAPHGPLTTDRPAAPSADAEATGGSEASAPDGSAPDQEPPAAASDRVPAPPDGPVPAPPAADEAPGDTLKPRPRPRPGRGSAPSTPPRGSAAAPAPSVDSPTTRLRPVSRKRPPDGGFGPTGTEPVEPSALFTPVTADTSTPPSGAPAGPTGEPPGTGYTVKGNVDSMLFHTPESPSYGRTTAEVWFRSAEEAEAAGFRSSSRV